ncbi:MarR family transcriptional regulator [Serratia marcescens]|jgi:Transcriptional regulators|nr:winged helix-turn-helix transcriptional regulator [Serratia marcescens]QDI27267.1 winged helix-turn-helix transcriptional regulator [Serratia marcescens]QDI41731.1 winged helix-turn-helix transcriptional regulator [Serratia marcescens]QDI46605.1 winged helix-turn-helix transcriptional regulator [Serratia marcescens]QDI56162.1 winged helix-turn-helix transcriptional regulator [Serratia marcescens]
MNMSNETALEYICNCSAIRQASRQMTRFYDSCLAEVGLRSTQYIILLILSRRGPITMASLSEETVLDRTTLTHSLQPLKMQGLISIDVGKEDRRSRLISLTDAGLEKVQQGMAAWQRAQSVFEEKFGQKQAAAMRQIMADVVNTKL